jgi:RHS repeat-associated protein
VESPFRLLGQYADDETGLCYTRFRFFDPETGGWCSPDPLGIRGGPGLFRFDGSPTNQIDPLGLSSYTASDISALINDSNTKFPLSKKNAETILGTGPENSTAKIAGSGGEGADVIFEDPHKNIVGRREVKCIAGNSQGSFNRQVGYAAKRQAGSGGEVFVQVKQGTSINDANRMVARFRGARTADELAKYSGTKLVIADPDGNVLYSGPLACNEKQ